MHTLVACTHNGNQAKTLNPKTLQVKSSKTHNLLVCTHSTIVKLNSYPRPWEAQRYYILHMQLPPSSNLKS